MLRLSCPVCGERDETEFTYEGDASVQRPDPAERDLSVWHDAVFIRDNPRGAHREYWHHLHGCRSLLIVERDTLTHAISGCRLAREINE